MTSQKQKSKVTILSDGPHLPTGYSNQAKQLVQYLLKKDYEIHWLANAYNGQTMNGIKLDDGTEINCKIYGEMTNTYFRNIISQHLKQTNSDYFIVLLDTFMLHGPDAWFLNIDTAPSKTFFWFPSDGGSGMPAGCERILQKIDCPIAMSKFGQKQVKDYYDLNVKYIPHGIDKKRFYKLPDDERFELRKKWGFEDKFVIGVVARNQPRKALDRTIKVMKLISEKIPSAVLFLHLDPNDPAQQMFRIGDLIIKYNLENRVVFSGMSAHQGIPWGRMNEIYNVMDVFLLTTTGEGFGIPIIEAMSCEVPILATDYTTTPELVLKNKAGLGINLSGVESIDMFKEKSQDYDLKAFNGTITGSWMVDRGTCSITDAADKLIYLYNNPKEREKMGQNGRSAVLDKYDFELVGKMWEEVLNDLSD